MDETKAEVLRLKAEKGVTKKETPDCAEISFNSLSGE